MAEADPTLKHLIDTSPPDWAHWVQRLCGVPEGEFTVESPNLSTRADADRVFRVKLPRPHLINLELEASRQPLRPERYLKFSVLLSDKEKLPVTTVAVVLCRAADSPDMTGKLERAVAGSSYLTFRYHVIRVWERPVEEFLTGGVGLLPLAPLAAKRKAELGRIVHRMSERLNREPPEVSQRIFATSEVLMGLRFPDMLIRSLLQGVNRMEKSVVYQRILKVGVEKGDHIGAVRSNRNSVLLFGGKRFGPPSRTVRLKLDEIDDADRLYRMMDSIDQTDSWDELLGVE